MKPEQRVMDIKSCIIPRIIHQLRLADVGIGKLKKVNKLIKKWVKKFLHIPEWTPYSWLHLKDGGDLAHLLELILKARKKASAKMATSEALQEVGSRARGDKREALGKTRLNWSPI